MQHRFLCTLAAWSVLAIPVLAGDKDKAKPVKPSVTPSERIEQLLLTLKNDRKEEQRSKAAEELGKLASAEYPEIVSGLIDALVRDESSSVRKTVVHSLAEIEPATHEVKDALDQAVKQDKTWTVRQAARIAVWRYKPKDEPPTIPRPKLRNTSKPDKGGTVPASKSAPVKPTPPVDPLKSLPIPEAPKPVVPVVPALPAPVMAPAPGLPGFSDPVPKTAPGTPAQLSAPKPSGN
ncbi:MAG TPA: HEAT repeat domain-containing protein [Gemmatales bacterium]|nr:HEAT repeat domain-containing protein [Gemmatales bacterium]